MFVLLIWLQAIMVVIYTFIGENVSALIKWVSFSGSLLHVLIMVVYFYIRYSAKWKDKPRPFKVCALNCKLSHTLFIISTLTHCLWHCMPDWLFSSSSVCFSHQLCVLFHWGERNYACVGITWGLESIIFQVLASFTVHSNSVHLFNMWGKTSWQENEVKVEKTWSR